MSHYTVLVVSTTGENNYEEQLAPYCEQDEEYEEFNKVVEPSNYEHFCMNIIRELNGNDESKTRNTDLIKEYTDLFTAGKFEEIIKSWQGGYFNEEEGAWGYDANPNAKWDWYQVGGIAKP